MGSAAVPALQAETFESLYLYNPGSHRNNFDGIVGVEFVAAPDVEITHLGFYDAHGDGLAAEHEVGLFVTGTGEEVAKVTVPAGEAAPYASFCRWVELDSPVALTEGTSYTVGAVVRDGGDLWVGSDGQAVPPSRFNSNVTTWLTDFVVGRWQAGTTSAGVPANTLGDNQLNRGYLAGNAAYTTPTEELSVTVDAGTEHQTIRSFGASDAWNVEFVGEYWEEAEKEKIAEWLFSTEMDEEGNPLGIGLSRWRYYIGSGSAQLGFDSGIDLEQRRTEGFLTDELTYDWDRQQGQNWFLEKAAEYGVEEFVGFAVSPPVQYTINGLSYPDEGHGLQSNLADDHYGDFADYLAEVAHHFETEKGITFDYISPVNEPQYDWEDPGQDGSPWTNEEIARLVRELDTSIEERNLDNSEIFLAEAGRIDHLLEESDPEPAEEVIHDLFDPQSASYVGDLANVAPIVSYHAYWVNNTSEEIRTGREDATALADEFGLELAQTEYSLLGILDILEGRPGGYLDIAMHQAKIVHSDLKYANVTSWSYWTSMEQERYNQRNRFELVWLTADSNFDLKTGGTAEPNKTMWAYGNFTRFIRPGYTRVEQTGADDLLGVMGTSYMAPDQSELVSVFINYGSRPKNIVMDYQNLPGGLEAGDQHTYVTSATMDLAYVGSNAAGEPVEAPLLSAVTVVTELGEGGPTPTVDKLDNGQNTHWLGRSGSAEDGPIFVTKPFYYHYGSETWVYLPNFSIDESTYLYSFAPDGGWLWTNQDIAPWHWNYATGWNSF
jgi:O-glycosyl hydrolase